MQITGYKNIHSTNNYSHMNDDDQHKAISAILSAEPNTVQNYNQLAIPNKLTSSMLHQQQTNAPEISTSVPVSSNSIESTSNSPQLAQAAQR